MSNYLQAPSGRDQEDETFERLKVHTELGVQVAVVVLGLYAVLGTQPRVTCPDQCSTT